MGTAKKGAVDKKAAQAVREATMYSLIKVRVFVRLGTLFDRAVGRSLDPYKTGYTPHPPQTPPKPHLGQQGRAQRGRGGGAGGDCGAEGEFGGVFEARVEGAGGRGLTLLVGWVGGV